jgi:hypothetical protein
MNQLPTIAGARLALVIVQLLQNQDNHGIPQIERLLARHRPEAVKICKLY